MTKHYTNKKTLEVYGYENDEVAKAFNEDHENLIEMTDALFQEYKKQPPGGTWTLKGWVVDMHEAQRIEKVQMLNEKNRELEEVETQIKRYERMNDRTETEAQELDALIEQATVLFREIKAAETEGEAQ